MYETALWAAIWWADKLRQGRPGYGIGEKQAEDALALAAALLLPKVQSETIEDQLQDFENLLAKRFDSELRDPGYVDLYRDYDTPPMILACMDESGIARSWDIKLPCKTGMKISKTNVMLKDGYGAHYLQVYPD